MKQMTMAAMALALLAAPAAAQIKNRPDPGEDPSFVYQPPPGSGASYHHTPDGREWVPLEADNGAITYVLNKPGHQVGVKNYPIWAMKVMDEDGREGQLDFDCNGHMREASIDWHLHRHFTPWEHIASRSIAAAIERMACYNRDAPKAGS